MKDNTQPVRLSDVLIALAKTLAVSGNNPEIELGKNYDFNCLFKAGQNEVNFYKSHLGKFEQVANDGVKTIN